MSRSKQALLVVGTLGLAMALAAAWWLGFLTPEPEEVSLAETVAAVEAAGAEGDEVPDAPTDAATSVPTATPVPAPTAEPESEATAPTAIAVPTGDTLLAGQWVVETGDTTFVGYRADSPTGEAVGRTRGVEGLLVASDTQILAVDLTADMATLASDSRFRDEHLGTEGLETRKFPTSRFVLTEPIAIDLVAAEGVSGEFEAIGELTVKESTQPITIDLEGTIVGEKLVVVGSTALDLFDYNATISGIEQATLEFSLVFSPKT